MTTANSPQYNELLATGYTVGRIDSHGFVWMNAPQLTGTVENCRCLHCDHAWEKRVDHRPVRCPVCKRANWDSPLKRKRKSPAEKEAKRDGEILRDALKCAGTDPGLLTYVEQIRQILAERARRRGEVVAGEPGAQLGAESVH